AKVQYLLPIHDEYGVATDKVADFLAEPQRMDWYLVRRKLLLRSGSLIRFDLCERLAPFRKAFGRHCAIARLAQLSEHGTHVAQHRNIDVIGLRQFRRIDLDTDDFGVFRETRGLSLAEN